MLEGRGMFPASSIAATTTPSIQLFHGHSLLYFPSLFLDISYHPIPFLSQTPLPHKLPWPQTRSIHAQPTTSSSAPPALLPSPSASPSSPTPSTLAAQSLHPAMPASSPPPSTSSLSASSPPSPTPLGGRPSGTQTPPSSTSPGTPSASSLGPSSLATPSPAPPSAQAKN